MQHIGEQRESEFGQVIESFDFCGLDTRVIDRAPSGSLMLRFIDPYGNTLFNQLQLSYLIKELDNLRATTPEADLRESLDQVLYFLMTSRGVHVYVRFIGD